MNDRFININVKDINNNTFELIGSRWLLIAAGSKSSFNMMTANWGGLGILWHRSVAICLIRPQRYTYEFVEKNECFTLSFYEERYREMLNLCGSLSGRNVNKAEVTGLTPVETSKGNIYFSQASLVLECKKLYSDDIKAEHFINKDIIREIYPKSDFHRFYFGEIVSCLRKV